MTLSSKTPLWVVGTLGDYGKKLPLLKGSVIAGKQETLGASHYSVSAEYSSPV